MTTRRINVCLIYFALAFFLLLTVWSMGTMGSSTLFYIAFTAISFAIAFAIFRRSSSEPSSHEVIFILVVALILRSIVPLSKPGSVIDNFPDAYMVRSNVLTLVTNSFLPTKIPDTAAGFFAKYPGVNLLLASLQMISAIDLVVLLRYLPVLLVVPVFGAVPVCVRAVGIRSRRAELVATVIVASIPFVMESTSHTSPHSYGTILFILGLAFFLDTVVGGKRRSAVYFIIVALSLVIYHLTSTVFLILVVSLFSLAAATPQLRRSSRVSFGSSLILLMVAAFAVWHAYAYYSTVPQLFDIIRNALFHEIRLSVAPAVPSGIKPLWMVMMEYLAFGSFGAAVLVSLFTKMDSSSSLPKTLALVGILLSSAFVAPWVIGLQNATDLIKRSFVLFMTTAAPLVGATLGSAIDNVASAFPRHFPGFKLRNCAAGALIALLVLNSVYYSFPVYYYDYSAPLQSEDTRQNLEAWQSLGFFASSHIATNESIWGPRLGRSLVGEYSGRTYDEFVDQTEGRAIIKASWFPYLSMIMAGKYVLISRSMLVAPEIRGYTPDIMTPSRISTRVYDNGEIVLLIAFAPETLVPASNSTLPEY